MGRFESEELTAILEAEVHSMSAESHHEHALPEKATVRSQKQLEASPEYEASTPDGSTVVPSVRAVTDPVVLSPLLGRTDNSTRARTIKQLQQSQGNAYVQQILRGRPSTSRAISVLQRARRTEPIQMPEETISVPVMTLPGTVTGSEQIDHQVNRMRTLITEYWENYHRGLASFRDDMIFSSEQEAESQYLKASLKAVGKVLLDQAIDKATEENPVFKATLGLVKELGFAWYEEGERIEKAEGEVKILDYITELTNSAAAEQMKQVDELDVQRAKLQQEYGARRAESGGDSSYGGKGPTQPGGEVVVVGEAAQFLKDLEGAVDRFRASIPLPAAFQQRLIEKFADTGGMTGLISQGGRLSGRLYLDVRIYKDGDRWSISSIDDAWTLATTAPNHEKIGPGLQNSLRAQGHLPTESKLFKGVNMTIEEEVFGPNDYYDGGVGFTDNPDNFQANSNYDPKMFAQAWQVPGIRKRILAVPNIRGSSK